MPKRWNPVFSEEFPDRTPEETQVLSAAAWHEIWWHVDDVAPMPVDDERTALQYVLDLISKGANSA